MKYKILDNQGNKIEVGTSVRLMSFSRDAQVIEIVDPDVDYNDERQRPVMSMPKIIVKFDDSGMIELETFNETKITWADYPDGPNEYTFVVDDDVIVNGNR